MVRCTQLLMQMLLLLVPLQGKGGFTGADRYKDINPANIRLKIKEKSDALNVMWKNPNKKITDGCYESHLQYKRQCDPHWLGNTVKSFNYTLHHHGRSYSFRVRMKHQCINNQPWSMWTAETHWKKGSTLDSCVEGGINFNAIFVIIPVISVLVIFAAQKRIKMLLLPNVPDPRHMYEDFLKIDQSQLEKTFKDCSRECMTLKIEIVQPEKEDDEEQEPERNEQPANRGDADVTPLTLDPAAGEPSSPANMHTEELSSYVCVEMLHS